MFQAVCRIRSERLPDPIEIPNVGSFFKNPVIGQEMADNLVCEHPDLPVYPYSELTCKVPAAWLIEHCGFKGCRRGDVGVHSNQALVIVNYGGEGNAVLELAEEIRSKVLQEFAIQLEIEPRIYDDLR